MLDCTMLDTAVQLGARVVDLDTGELLRGGTGREEALPAHVVNAEKARTRWAAFGSRAGGAPSGDSAGPNVQGLSTAHNPTVGDEKPNAITGWVGGSLLKVQHAGPYNLPGVGGGKRGKIKGYSRGARRRFQRLMATVQKKDLPIFATLTYPDQFPDDLQTWGRHLEALRMRIKRKGWGCIWRREFKTRKSGQNAGKVAPHYHLLIWGGDYVEIRAYLGQAWYEICGRICPEHLAAGCRVELLRSWDGVNGYVSKYMAKIEDMPCLENSGSIGRFWGVINREAIPWAEAVVMTIDSTTVNTFFRYMRRYAHLKARGSWPSLSVFVDDPWKWLQAASKTESMT